MDRNLKIGIVGLGLIGGSIFKALCALKCDVCAVSRSNQTLNKAKKYSTKVSKSLLILKECDVVFVCTPINKTLEILEKLNNILNPNTIVTDVCSLKNYIPDKNWRFKFIPSHPMAGTEFMGFDYSFESLFQDAKWVITPFKENNPQDMKILIDIIEVLGAKPIFTTAKEHDEATALISHMPMLISQALFETAKSNPLALKLASSGFRDMTRLALSNEEMANDMIKLNSVNIENALLKLYTSIGNLLSEDYASKVRNIKKDRQMMYIDGKNIL